MCFWCDCMRHLDKIENYRRTLNHFKTMHELWNDAVIALFIFWTYKSTIYFRAFMAKQKLCTSKIKYLDAFMRDLLVPIWPCLRLFLNFSCILVLLALYCALHLFH